MERRRKAMNDCLSISDHYKIAKKSEKRAKQIAKYLDGLKEKGIVLDDDMSNVLHTVINYSNTINYPDKIKIIKKSINNLHKKKIGFVYFWDGLLLMINDPFLFIEQNNITPDNVDQVIDSIKKGFTLDGIHSVLDEAIEVISGLHEFYLIDTYGS